MVSRRCGYVGVWLSLNPLCLGRASSPCKKQGWTLTSPHIEMIKYMNVRAKPIKFFEETTAANLSDFEFGNEFLDRTPKV